LLDNYDTLSSDMKTDSTALDKAPAAGRPRDLRIDASILRAAADLLVTIGYSNLTMAAVAERAGTTKTALYRRWSSKAELVHEAAFPATPSALIAPSTSFADDVRAMVEATRDVFTTPVVRAALPGLVADMASDADLNARVMRRFTGLFGAVRERVDRAVKESDARADANPDRLVEVIGGATLMRLLLRPGEPLDDDWVLQTAAIVVNGVVA
jgi:AcrR family transcriptional regulator